MKVLYLVESRSTIGGGVKATRNLASMVAKEHGAENVAIFGPSQGEEEKRYITFSNEGINPLSPKFFFILKHTLAEFKPRIVHAMGLFTGFVLYLYKILFRERYKLVVTVHRTTMRPRFYPLSILPAKLLSTKVDWATFLTDYQKNHYCEKLGFCPKTVSIIPNVILQKEISEDSVTGIRKNIMDKLKIVFLVAYAGRLIPSKQIDVFISTIQKLRQKGLNAGGVIVGDGPSEYVMPLRLLVQDLRLENKILFTGFKNNPEEYIASCDCILFPTQHREALPNLLIESFSMGKPVVVSDIPPLKDLIENLNNGLVVSEHNPEAYATALLELHGNLDLKEKLSLGAKNTFEKQYAPETVYRKYLEIYKAIDSLDTERV